MTAIYVDTSALYAVYSLSDARHEEAVALLREFKKRRVTLVTSDLILLESYILVHSRGGLASLLAFRTAMDQSSWLQIVPTTSEHHAAGWGLLEQRIDKGYSFVDAVSFVVMRALGVKRAFTFDAHFSQEGFDVEKETTGR
jgi:predicted nucleic acid-binding protein